MHGSSKALNLLLSIQLQQCECPGSDLKRRGPTPSDMAFHSVFVDALVRRLATGSSPRRICNLGASEY